MHEPPRRLSDRAHAVDSVRFARTSRRRGRAGSSGSWRTSEGCGATRRVRGACLLSQLGAGLNANVTRVRTDRAPTSRTSCAARTERAEHASYSFALRNVSRTFTHELVRHRAARPSAGESALRAPDGHRLPRAAGARADARARARDRRTAREFSAKPAGAGTRRRGVPST